jgi:CrcB protein
MLKNVIFIGLGGFIGSIFRYFVALLAKKLCLCPFASGTFFVNIIGSFVIGMLFACFLKSNENEPLKLFLTTGICGGFTTFSAFSLENLQYLQQGQVFLAAFYIAASIITCLFAVWLGYFLIK